MEKGINPWYMLEMLFYYSPAVFVLTVPMATLVGIVTAFGRLSADNEIIAMKTSGIGMQKLIVPVVLSTFILSVFMVFFMDFSIPRGNQAYYKLYVELRQKHPALVLEPDTIMEEMSTEGRKWYFKSIDRQTGKMKDIMIWERDKDVPRLITAKEGELRVFDKWTSLLLYDGKIYQADPQNPLKGYSTGNFTKNEIILDIGKSLEKEERASWSPTNMSIKEIKENLKKFEAELASPFTTEYVKNYIRKYQINEYKVELYKKVSIPFANLAFGLIGVPLGLFVRRGGRMVGLGVGVAVIIVYYVILTIGEKISKAGIYPPVLGAWTPNIVIGIAGIILIMRTIREMPIHSIKLLDKLFPSEHR